MNGPALHHWAATAGAPIPILPDGCRDLIWIQAPGAAPQVAYTGLTGTPTPSRAPRGAKVQGIRLAPGWQVSPQALRELQARSPDDPGDIARALPDICTPQPEAQTVLRALGMADISTVARAARHCGISTRSLQRILRQADLPAPVFWLQLARARRAGRALLSDDPLAEIAAGGGFSDQAHMARALGHWFGAPPRRLRADPAFTRQIAGLGFGD